MQFHPLPNLWPSLMWAPRLSPTTGLYVTSASECQFFLLREDHENCQNFVYVFYSNQFLIDYSSLEFYPVKHSCYIHRYSLVLKKNSYLSLLIANICIIVKNQAIIWEWNQTFMTLTCLPVVVTSSRRVS